MVENSIGFIMKSSGFMLEDGYENKPQLEKDSGAKAQERQSTVRRNQRRYWSCQHKIPQELQRTG